MLRHGRGSARSCQQRHTSISPLCQRVGRTGGPVWIRQLLDLAATTRAATGSFCPFCWALAGTLPCSQREAPINPREPGTLQDPYTHCSAPEVPGTYARGCSVLRLVIRRRPSAPQQRRAAPKGHRTQPQNGTRAHAPSPETRYPVHARSSQCLYSRLACLSTRPQRAHRLRRDQAAFRRSQQFARLFAHHREGIFLFTLFHLLVALKSQQTNPPRPLVCCDSPSSRPVASAASRSNPPRPSASD